jgi:hypothetical protein
MFLPSKAAFFATLLVAASLSIPAFNVESHCRAVAKRSGASRDLEVCLQQEKQAKDQLTKQWSQFTPAEKSHCERLSTLGGNPIYTELLTCLELQQDARKAREKNESSAARQGRR